jgi:nucleotide-binding universal stress UspA family protein
MAAPQIQLVGYDGSSLSERALRRAVVDASQLDFAVLHVVTVVEELGDEVRLPSGERMSRWAALRTLRLTVDQLLEAFGVPARLLRVSGHLRGGDPAQALIDLAYRHHVERLLVGAHGDSPGALGRIGGVAGRVLRLADFPVHVESPLLTAAPRRTNFDPLRFAFVFGGALGPTPTPSGAVPHS